MAVAFDAVSSGVNAAVGTTLTVAHTAGAGATIAIVGLSFRTLGSLPTGIAVTYDGVAMTHISTVGGGAATVTKASLWYIANPPASAANVVATWTNDNWCVMGITSFTGSAGTVSGTQSFESGSTSAPTIDITSATGAMVTDVCATAGTSSTAAGTGSTERYEVHATPNQCSGSGSTEPGASTVTLDWTFGAADQAVQIGVSVDDIASGYSEPRTYAVVIH